MLYFAQYLVTTVEVPLREAAVDQLREDLTQGLEKMEAEAQEKLAELRPQVAEEPQESEAADDEESSAEDTPTTQDSPVALDEATEKAVLELNTKLEQDKADLENDVIAKIDELEDLRVGQLLTESRYRELRDSHGGVFRANMGAEAVLEVLKEIDLDTLRDYLQDEMRSTSGQRRKKAIKRMRVVEAFRKSENKADWMVFTMLPVLPPELRPMVQLDGGRFATSDLNDLYRRVINRNNRLKRLIELQAPEIIVRNEKRMLQEAVDALVDNGRRGRPVSGSHNHRLKSLSDLLRGKQGRFRQNLLGKRVDYSGRSVIIAGPELRLNECGLPRRMALELFKPFVMNRLVMKGYAHNIKSAKRMAERVRPEVWDILEEVVSDRPILLNRAPTLHRLGIQAFQPVLIDGAAIQVHPLVCTAFNADFDGDQMAVHVPLSREAVLEAKRMMLSIYNLLSPSSGEPIVAPTLDIVLGCYYMTMLEDNTQGEGMRFTSFDDALLAHNLGRVDLRARVHVRNGANGKTEWLETSVGRILFNEVLPKEISFRNQEMDKGALKDVVAECYRKLSNQGTADVLDAIKTLGFHHASKAGITIAINDIEVSPEKDTIVHAAEGKVSLLEQQYLDGLITEDERYSNTVQVWTDANDELTGVIESNLHNYVGIYLMATSGAKGNIAQIKQMVGMRGLMSDPKGRVIDRPIKSNFREGLSVLEYFISTHGARKGLADTALRTADSGYLTRRLIDVAQEIIILSDDCETVGGVWIQDDEDSATLLTSLSMRLKSRYTALPVPDPTTGEILMDRNEELNDDSIGRLLDAKVTAVMVRSPLTCESRRGVCHLCYGISLATMRPAMLGEAVGIIAAQSIGEPGTQLTMRTFHTGGIAGSDITSGLPRVEELFEARTPKGEAVLSEIDGTVDVSDLPDGRSIRVANTEEFSDEYPVPAGHKLLVKDKDLVSIGTQLAEPEEAPEEGASPLQSAEVVARVSGTAHVDGESVTISWTDEEQREYIIPAAAHITVKSGDQVIAGQALTSGPKSPQQILRIQGRDAVQRYLIREVQRVYRSQGVPIHDKHVEVIIAQMLRKVRIDGPGDTGLLPGELVDRRRYEEINSGILAEGGEPATASPVLLGITRASLQMDSFLAAASFQETTRVLTEAAVNGDIDPLRGLKENVIIGRLIPARFDLSEEGRKRLGLDEIHRNAAGALSTRGDAEIPPPFELEEAMEETPAL